MKAVPLALAFGLCLCASATDTIELPQNNAVIAAEVPDYWHARESGGGILAESPARVGMIHLQLVEATRSMDSIIEESVRKLADDNDVIVDTQTQEKWNFDEHGRKWKRITWTGNGREWGPTLIGILSTEVESGRKLIITYWLAERDSAQSLKSLEQVFASVRPTR